MKSSNWQEEFALFGDDTGVVARAVTEPRRSVESLPLAALGDFVRGRMSEGDVSQSGERQAPC